MPKDEQGYQGWTNHETWVTKLWIDNDEGSYNLFQELTQEVRERAKTCQQVKEKIWTIKEAEKLLLAKLVHDEVETMVKGNEDQASLATDLLNASISNINFVEIAENLLSE